MRQTRFCFFSMLAVNIKMLPRKEDVSWHLERGLRKLSPQQGTAESQEFPKLRFLVSQNITLTDWIKFQKRITDHNKCSA